MYFPALMPWYVHIPPVFTGWNGVRCIVRLPNSRFHEQKGGTQMDKREIELVFDLCHEVDLLVSKDSGNATMEVLEQDRLKMNDLLWKQKYREAEIMAYAILLKHSGGQAGDYLSEECLGQ
jgi:hypothetical protein